MKEDRLERMFALVKRFVDERDWEQFHDPKNLAMAVVSEAGELAAELRWVDSKDADAFCQEAGNRARIEDEVADVTATLLMFCARVGIDLPAALERKMSKNEQKYPVEECRGI